MTTAAEVDAALLAAMAADPGPWAATTQRDAGLCEIAGVDPDNPDQTPVQIQNAACQTFIFALYNHYISSGVQADFDATLVAYNFAILQAIGYPDLVGAQPSDSAAVFKAFLDGQLLAANWFGGGS